MGETRPPKAVGGALASPPQGPILYASDSIYLDVVLAEEKYWKELAIPPVGLVVFRREGLAGFSVDPCDVITQERKGAEP